MANSLFSFGDITPRPPVHTPTTFGRIQRRLFTPTPPRPTSTPSGHDSDALPPGVTPPNSPGSTRSPAPPIHHVLPWETPGVKTTVLYRTAAPKLKYPAGSTDEVINQRFLRQMDMYLFQNFQARAVLVGHREHPFSSYPRLSKYFSTTDNNPNWSFNTENTFAVMNKVKANGHLPFYRELNDLLWFGDILSYVRRWIREIRDEQAGDQSGLSPFWNELCSPRVVIGWSTG